MTEREPGEPDLIEDAENQAPAAAQPTAATPRTEIIEDLYENPE
jgi:hypothetical protein